MNDYEVPVRYLVGNSYPTQDGRIVKIVCENLRSETIIDENGVHYYNRPHDRGRVTGTSHDYSYHGNLVRMYLKSASQEENQKLIKEVSVYREAFSDLSRGMQVFEETLAKLKDARDSGKLHKRDIEPDIRTWKESIIP